VDGAAEGVALPIAVPGREWAKGGHGYGPEVVCLFLQLVLVANVSLRGAARVLGTVGQVLGLRWAVPNWTTGRLWLLRLGHAMLTGALEPAGDWAWLIDHSVQIGPEKCLVILGIRLRDLPPPGQCLRHQDLRLIALMPASRWTRADVDQALEQAAFRTGVPRVIVDDHGGDISGGVALFQERHPQTAEIYDAKHKAACLLKHRLEKCPRWQEFQSRVGPTRCAVQQTELAFLTPPSPKPKARFMNLGTQLAWARRVLAILRQPPPSVQQRVRPERLKEKLGWIEGFASELIQWSQWQQVVDVTVTLVNQQGLGQGTWKGEPSTADLLAQQLSHLDAHGDSAIEFAAELIGFVRGEQIKARPGERFPGSTEILESCFGKYKQLEKQQSRGGFTQLLLAFGALLARTASTTIREAMQRSRTPDVRRWAEQTLGTTLFAQRKLAFSGATENG
jgi:hypothetical protein